MTVVIFYKVTRLFSLTQVYWVTNSHEMFFFLFCLFGFQHFSTTHSIENFACHFFSLQDSSINLAINILSFKIVFVLLKTLLWNFTLQVLHTVKIEPAYFLRRSIQYQPKTLQNLNKKLQYTLFSFRVLSWNERQWIPLCYNRFQINYFKPRYALQRRSKYKVCNFTTG